MLRVRTIHATAAVSAANYYTRYLAEAPGEVPGVWTGDQAVALGLTGDVNGEDLLALLEGRDPASGTQLGRALADRALANGTVVKAVAGFDATFSAPKSLSALWALTQDPELLAAHDNAVAAALRHLERYGATTRVRADGRRLHPDSQGLTMATFRQTTSREDDPQIHTHAVISAKVQTDDGRWLALDARYLKKHQRMLGGLYQSVLRNELTHRFGIAWEPLVQGQAEMAGVPAEVLAAFSKRTDQITVAVAANTAEFARREGRDPNHWELGAIKREASADTRSTKTGTGVAELVTRWHDEAAAVGWTRDEIVRELADTAGRQPVEAAGVGIAEVVDVLSRSGSAWNRAQIVQALCDVARPDPTVDGGQWAERIETWCDHIIDRCVELDPNDAAAPRRRSDGRSMWLEPISAHITTDAIAAEEELVLSWAIDAQLAEPRPSSTVDGVGLDVLQADVARAVAGDDRLVLVVGPAGAGKTTTLRAAADDLHAHARAVFGVAPSAKAARVLERETGVASDTLAKLLYEWVRSDRPPGDRYRLGAGTTVLVDEAGMVGTGSLAQLVELTQRQGWRLALVGDPRQLQAVGRGGIFHELCAQGRAHTLARIHRFREPWEAAASLQLRRGDPRGLDAYLAHRRVIADTFDHLLDVIADKWLTTTADGGAAAITASSNEHVDAINVAVQRARIDVGHLDPDHAVGIGGGEQAHVGDVVVTRRNDRRLTTTMGEPIRNRETWTVTGLHLDGSITVSSPHANGTATFPADYTREHVRLGYAATEHGNQGDTTTIGIELASPVTTRRGLYVGVSRGHAENLILVVSDTRDLDEARDLLERIITTDRADIPAVTQRRQLAAADRPPGRRVPAPAPRCEIPAWFHDLQTAIAVELADASARATADQRELDELLHRRADAETAQAAARRGLDPHQPALAAARHALDEAHDQQRAAARQLEQARPWNRRSARRQLDDADRSHQAAVARHRHVDTLAAPARAAHDEAVAMVRQLDSSIRATRTLHRWDGNAEAVHQLRHLANAVDRWHDWATGKPLRRDQVIETTHTLIAEPQSGHGSACYRLADLTISWARRVAPDLTPAMTPQPVRPPPSLGLEIEL